MKTRTLGRPCIVEGMYFRDVGHIVAPGGVGKTTLLLHHCIQIVTGGSIFGREVRMAGPVVYISAEDDSDSLGARLWQMCKDIDSKDDLEAIEKNLHIIDTAGHSVKLTTVEKEAVVPSRRLDTLIATLQQIDPVMVFIDPLVSFGIGESRVNDAEQGMIEAGRRIVKQVGCGVLFVHHTGKSNVREGDGKQYSGRGGSALADGSRMVFTLENVPPDKWQEATGDALIDGESALLFSSPKLTWCSPQPPIYLKRTGFAFLEFPYVGGTEGAQDRAIADAEKLHAFLKAELLAGRHHTGRSLEDIGFMKQKSLRSAIHTLKDQGRTVDEKEEGGGRGGARTWLRPVDRT
ncbi:MAG: hypothetical protein FD144_2061 [Rhodospirillaceae bacterium]|nr:MAG: hypothetical protein FD144_2061 [Rhodospirillaceae bacterium]